MDKNSIPEGFLAAEKEMLEYFGDSEKGYRVEVSNGQMTVTDTMSEYWVDLDLDQCSRWRFCTDEEVPEEGLIRFFYGDRDWEMLFINDAMMKEILGSMQIRLVAFRKPPAVSDY